MGLKTRFLFLTDAGFLMWDALHDERAGLSFTMCNIFTTPSRESDSVQTFVIKPEVFENISDINTEFYNPECFYALTVSMIGTLSLEPTRIISGYSLIYIKEKKVRKPLKLSSYWEQKNIVL
jgi:hypothetical protein